MNAYAYQEFQNAAIIGPLHVHKVGDVIELPARKHDYLGHEIEGDVFVVQRIEKDGAAFAMRKSVLDARGTA